MDAFAFAIEIGNMRVELYNGLYYQLAVNAWLITYYWVAQKAVRKVSRKEEAEKMIWSTIIPHFTAKGIQAFKAFYGTTYLDSIGKPFKTYIRQEKIF